MVRIRDAWFDADSVNGPTTKCYNHRDPLLTSFGVELRAAKHLERRRQTNPIESLCNADSEPIV
jgi:hypothetical protein